MKKKSTWLRTIRRRKLPIGAMLFCVAALVALMAPVAAPAEAAPATAPAGSQAGQFDLDVIFVIDNSGSMNQSDPNKLALTAANLFVDMCEGSDSRAGYVMYTHQIVAERELTDLISFSRDIKKEIAATKYVRNGDTDIALGLETALSMFAQEAAAGTNTRKPVIILLSDGNTDLPKGPRTVAESQAALEQAKKDAANMGIPIFTVGFNHDGSLDMDTMQDIAHLTGGIMREAGSADELPGILREIYGDLTGATSENMTMTATGSPQSVVIPVNVGSIYKTTITIMSSQPVSDISIAMPDGRDPGPDRVSTNTDPNGRYTLLTVFKPEVGDWVLTFTGTEGDTVSIDLLSIYDLTLVFDLPRTSLGMADFSWRLEEHTGAAITDPELLDVLEPVLHARNTATGDETVEAFPPGQRTMSLPFEGGDYEAYLAIENQGIVRTSNEQSFSVPFAPPLALSGSLSGSDNTYSVTLMTIFNEDDTVALRDLVDFAKENRPLTIGTEAGQWADIVDFDYSAADETIALSALSPGTEEITVTVSDPHGHSVDFYIAVKVRSGLIPIIAAALLLLAGAVAAIVIMLGKRPRLNDPMSKVGIKMALPTHSTYDTPQESALSLPQVKGKKTLQELINMNVSISEPYRLAFEPISWFPNGTVFSAKTKSLLEVKIPSSSGYTVKVDRQAGKGSVTFDRNGGTEIRIGSSEGADYSEYVITLGNTFDQRGPAAEEDWPDFDSPGGKAPERDDNDGFW